jgi:hypothetical protein
MGLQALAGLVQMKHLDAREREARSRGNSLAKATVAPQHVAVSKRGRYAAGGGGGGFGGLGGGSFGGLGGSMDNPFRSWLPRRRRET